MRPECQEPFSEALPRIALVTPFAPEIGGGSAQLRSHLRHLPEMDVRWHYLAPQAGSYPQSTWLGNRFSAGELLSDLSARTGFLPGSTARARQLVSKIEADLYWVVGHYEGICIAAELCAQGKRVHLTVHDDPFGTFVRSNRFRWFRPLLWRTFPQLLRAAQTIDVTSWGMRNWYRQKYGVKCFSVYLHVPALPKLNLATDRAALTIGHIGTLYEPEMFLKFVSACKLVAGQTQRQLRIVRIGASPEMDTIAAQNPQIFQSHGDLSEADAIPLLAKCDLLYAMYPPGRKYELFRRTSLPIKVSTYIQAQRSVFAHSPEDSTLACVVRKYRLGSVCQSRREVEISAAIDDLLREPVARHNFEVARADLMGFGQLQHLAAALRGEAFAPLPESDC